MKREKTIDSHFRRLVLAAIICLTAFASWSQAPSKELSKQVIKDEKIILFGDGRPDTSAFAHLITNFYLDQFRHIQDPRAPYFLLMSRNGKLAMGVGGKLEADMSYDWHGSIPGTDFAPFEIAIPANHADINRYQTYIGNSSLFLTVFGKSDRFGFFKVYIEAKFSGGDNSKYLKLKKAYAIVGDWTLGYTKSTFSDPAAVPATVESEGPNACVDDTRFLLRYMHGLTKNFSFALAAETPHDGVPDETSYYSPACDYMPNFTGFLQWGWDDNSQHVRLSGIVKGMRYRNLYLDKNSYATGWGINLSTVFRPIDPVTVYAAGHYGAGISSMVNDLSFGDLDLMPVRQRPGKMEPPRNFGWYAGIQYNFTPKVFSTIVVSQERLLPGDKNSYASDTYKYGLYGVANVFWDITPRCEVGAEIDLGKRCNQDGAHRMAYRAGLIGTFSF